jgi:tRNA(Ile)-lysidine synthase
LVKSANVRKRVKETGDNLEQAARLMRYECLKQAAEELNAEILVTAHTLDDQAETIIMRLLRGSGAEGLSGIEPVRRLDDVSKLLIARPLVSWARRDETEQYCRKHKVRFRVDEMNDDVRFTRVRIRKELMPLMSSFNRKFVETLARTAALLREDASALSSEAEALLDTARNGDETQPGSLSVNLLRQAPAAVRRRALRQWIASASGHLKRVEMVHLLSIDKILESSKGTVVEMPRGIRISRKGGRLYISVKKVEKGVSGL